MTRLVKALAEVLVWWVVLGALWLNLVSTIDPLEGAVGGASALLAAIAARAARRVATRESVVR